MRKYSMSLISAILLSMAGIAFFNWLINPYEIFDSPNIKGLNEYKVEANRHTRLSKAYQVDTIRPDVILLASSRGLVVPESYFSNEGEKPLNLALASASTYELLRYFQHANATRQLKRVVLALDEEFTDLRQAEFSEDRLKVNVDGQINTSKNNEKLRDWVNSLISLDAFKASWRTIKRQKESPDYLSEEKYMQKRVTGAGGHRQMFRKMEASLFAKSIFKQEDDAGIQAKHYFEKIVEMAYRDNIEVIIYFSPVHVRYFEALNIMGKWSGLEEMKRFVIHTVENMAKRYNREAFTVWDFSGYNVVTTETVPELGDVEKTMHWYWEGSHYTRKTAGLIFSRITHDDIDDMYKGFGVQLNSGNIEQHFLNTHKQRSVYNFHSPENAEELKIMYRSMVSAINDRKNR